MVQYGKRHVVLAVVLVPKGASKAVCAQV
eukprot:COSAG02_NODE_15207_length_1193_cov_28.136197_1_plen_28_part_10